MRELVFLDTETTGNEIGKDRLCQLCYKNSEGVKTAYFKPPIPISVKAMSITHITNKMVEKSEPFAGSKMSAELELLLEKGILVAHNARFDIAMLEAEGIQVPNYICTLRVARYLDENNLIPEYGLQFLRYFLGLDVEGEGKAHDALADVNTLYALFDRLLSKIKEKVSNEDEAIKKMIEISQKPVLFKKINFGKYKDQCIEDILKNDRGYLEWLLRTKLSDNSQDEDWIYTLKQCLGN